MPKSEEFDRLPFAVNALRATGMIGATRPWEGAYREPFGSKNRRKRSDQVLGDPDEWIQKCLNCNLPECINCLHHASKSE